MSLQGDSDFRTPVSQRPSSRRSKSLQLELWLQQIWYLPGGKDRKQRLPGEEVIQVRRYSATEASDVNDKNA